MRATYRSRPTGRHECKQAVRDREEKVVRKRLTLICEMESAEKNVKQVKHEKLYQPRVGHVRPETIQPTAISSHRFVHDLDSENQTACQGAVE